MSSIYALVVLFWALLLVVPMAQGLTLPESLESKESFSGRALLKGLLKRLVPPHKGAKPCMNILNQTGALVHCADIYGAKWNIEDGASAEAEDNSCMAMFDMMDCINNVSYSSCAYEDAVEIEAYRLKVMKYIDQNICPTMQYKWNRGSLWLAEMTLTAKQVQAKSTTKVPISHAMWTVIIVLIVLAVILVIVALFFMINLNNDDSDTFFSWLSSSLLGTKKPRRREHSSSSKRSGKSKSSANSRMVELKLKQQSNPQAESLPLLGSTSSAGPLKSQLPVTEPSHLVESKPLVVDATSSGPLNNESEQQVPVDNNSPSSKTLETQKQESAVSSTNSGEIKLKSSEEFKQQDSDLISQISSDNKSEPIQSELKAV